MGLGNMGLKVGIAGRNQAAVAAPVAPVVDADVIAPGKPQVATDQVAGPPERPQKKELQMSVQLDEPGPEDFKHLGDLLVYLRQTYSERSAPQGVDRPRIELRAAAVVEYLRKHGYSMTSGSYSLLEQGKTLPRNPERFLDIISACLIANPHSKYHLLLRRQYIYDHAARFVGKPYADQMIPHGAQLLSALRASQTAANTAR